MALAAAFLSAQQGDARPLSIDDVLDLARIDQVTLSPDRAQAAIVLQRPARPGEIYGRTAYEVDPARSDIWLVSLRTGERRNITRGVETAAGFWCAAWSPDGSRLAMLSTRPEGGEPHGGDNVRLYVWDAASGALRRLSAAAAMTQTRYGSPLYQLDLRGGPSGPATHRCSDEENAPFLWLNGHELLAVTLPAGAVAGLIAQYGGPTRHADLVAERLRAGAEATMTAVGSGAERLPESQRTMGADLRLFDLASGAEAIVSSVPIYPFRGELTLSVAPNGRHAAVLTATGEIQPVPNQRAPTLEDTWYAEKRLGFVNLREGADLRWASMPHAARFPLELLDWSADSRRVALRARGRFDERETPLFVGAVNDLSVRDTRLGTLSVGGPWAGAAVPHENPVFWTGNDSLLVHAAEAHVNAGAAAANSPRMTWWLLRPGSRPIDLSEGGTRLPDVLRRSAPDQFFGVTDEGVVQFDARRRRAETRRLPDCNREPSISWPRDAHLAVEEFVVSAAGAEGNGVYCFVSLRTPDRDPTPLVIPSREEILGVGPDRGTLVSRQATQLGTYITLTGADGTRRALLSANTHLADVDWGERRLIQYRGRDGAELQAAVILPPGYREGERYPVITWVYPGNVVRSLDTYFLDPYLPGIYNLQLYAAHGYVVLIPSMPAVSGLPGHPLADLSRHVLPAVDRMVELGIADPARVGLMGQSFGGFATYGLLTQTHRFRAAVAMAGITDRSSFYFQFDPTARGYPGIEHERSFNAALSEVGTSGLGVAPFEDPGLYRRESPIAFVDRVDTPLLLIHGEYDSRAPMSQAEAFFYALYRRGKTARLLRYWGETHSLAQSPANVRSIHGEILGWFDRYLGGGSAAPAGD